MQFYVKCENHKRVKNNSQVYILSNQKDGVATNYERVEWRQERLWQRDANKGPIFGYESFEVPMKYANDGGDEAADG